MAAYYARGPGICPDEFPIDVSFGGLGGRGGPPVPAFHLLAPGESPRHADHSPAATVIL